MIQPARPQAAIALCGGTLIVILAIGATAHGGTRLAAAALIGAVAGIALAHAAFGFTGGWRRFIVERRGAGLRSQLLLVGLTTALVLPLLRFGSAFGLEAGGFVFPMGVPVAIGAFLFGIGMQLAGGCASGTLFTVGGGSVRMALTLAFFIAGGLLATLSWPFWQSLPQLPPLSLVDAIGPVGGLAATLAALLAIAHASASAERARYGSLAPGPRRGSLLSGPWSRTDAAVVLAVVGALTVAVLGHPWGITSGLTLWGAQIATALGAPIDKTPYWTDAMAAVHASPLADGTSVMNFGIMAGALLATALAGRVAPSLRLTGRQAVTAMVGGLLMGYGARLAYGCNIGALLGGIASGSLHGWGWFAFAYLGSVVGIRLDARGPALPRLTSPVQP